VLLDKLDTAKMHGFDMSNVSSRNVTSQMEYGFIIDFAVSLKTIGMLLISMTYAFQPLRIISPSLLRMTSVSSLLYSCHSDCSIQLSFCCCRVIQLGRGSDNDN